MTKVSTPTPSAAAPDAIGDFPLSLDEFCQRLSKTDRRVEMIGAFYSVEKAAGRTKGLTREFTSRFEAFVKSPA